MTEDERVGWHHRLDGRELEQAPGVGDVQRSLACCRPWGRKESDTTERLSWTEYIEWEGGFAKYDEYIITLLLRALSVDNASRMLKYSNRYKLVWGLQAPLCRPLGGDGPVGVDVTLFCSQLNFCTLSL